MHTCIIWCSAQEKNVFSTKCLPCFLCTDQEPINSWPNLIRRTLFLVRKEGGGCYHANHWSLLMFFTKTEGQLLACLQEMGSCSKLCSAMEGSILLWRKISSYVAWHLCRSLMVCLSPRGFETTNSFPTLFNRHRLGHGLFQPISAKWKIWLGSHCLSVGQTATMQGWAAGWNW